MNYQDRLFRQSYGYECEPTTILMVASLAISAMSSVAMVQGQKATAKAQESYQNQLTNANNAAAEQQAGAIRDQQAQQREAQARDLQKANLATQRSVSTASTMAAENGQQGASVEALLAEYDMQNGQYKEAVLRQRQLNDQATSSSIEALKTGTLNQNLSINAPIQQAQPFAAAVNFAGQALGAYHAYNPEQFQIKK